MTVPLDQALIDALGPVRRALLAAAHADADQTAATGDARVAEILEAARAQAAQILSDARQAGAMDAGATFAAQRAQARRNARAQILLAQRLAYERLRSRALAAVVALRHEPDYADLRAALVRAARRLLGPAADIRDTGDGGIAGQHADRRIDLSLTGFAARAVDAVLGAGDRP